MESKFNNMCGSCFGCVEIYKLLGRSKGPPVALKVIIAFLAPLVIFIAAAVIAEKIFGDRISSGPLKILVVWLLWWPEVESNYRHGDFQCDWYVQKAYFHYFKLFQQMLKQALIVKN